MEYDNKRLKGDLNDAVRFLGDIQSSFRARNVCMTVMAVLCAVICIGTVVTAESRADTAARNVYVIDQGSVLEAARADNGEQRDLEVEDHVTRFHELMFNLVPNIETINQNISRALEMADRSAYDYQSDLREKKYYARLIDINAVQEIGVDSVEVDMAEYPYPVRVKASLYVMRESNITMYTMQTSCRVAEAPRSKANPHGLMVTEFYATKPEMVGSRRR